ncbi:MAG: hypothetical protein KME26_29660 [Oscillatoria princeps RMCB-10]|jgi:ankyrin repeat protein|nr:hypothetical protein [Oscillatoria princeps RMCB-10]
MALLLENGADVHVKNRWGGTPLNEAKKSFRPQQAVELLLRAGAVE